MWKILISEKCTDWKEFWNAERMGFFSSFCLHKAAVCEAFHDNWRFIYRKNSNPNEKNPNLFLFNKLVPLSLALRDFCVYPRIYIRFSGSVTDDNIKQFMCSHLFLINETSGNPKEMVHHCNNNCSHLL